MASTRQEYFILRNDVPISKTNNFWKIWLSPDHVMKGELLVKVALPQDGSYHAIYSLALGRHKVVSCSNSDVAPLSKDDYEWLAAIGKTVDRWQVYYQGDKLEAVKKLQVGDKVWVSLPLGDGTPSHLWGPSCCHVTVQYIGPLQDTPGRWIGVELKVTEKRGSCDGRFRDTRYFACEDGYGAFLPASSILAVPQSSSAPPLPTSSTSTHKKLLLSSTRNKTDRDFYLDDPVVVFDKDGRRVPGVAKWAKHGKERGLDCYIIGIETDKPIKKEKVEGHISNMGHLFPYPHDYKKHTYLAVPEVSVLKEREGTPVEAHSEVMDHTNPPDVTESVRAVASTRNTTSAESQPRPTQPLPHHLVSHNLDVGSAVEWVDPPGCGIVRWIGKFPGVNHNIAGVELDMKVDGCGDGSWNNKRYFTCKDGYAMFIVLSKLKPDQRFLQQPKGNNLEGIFTTIDERSKTVDVFNPTDVTESVHTVASTAAKNTRSTTSAESQPQLTQPIPPRPVSHNLEVGSAVELVDPPGYGIIRWIGKLPDLDIDIAGVELDTRTDLCGDGSWNGQQYFSCRDGHAVFIVLSKLKPDSRFVQQPQEPNQPSMEMSCSCECQLIKDQVTEIKTDLCYQEDNVKEIDCQIKEYIRQNRLLREELTTVKGQVGSCEEALQASKEALQAKDQQIERLQSEVQALQHTSICLQEGNVTERRLLREELATVRDAKNQQTEELQQTIADLREEQLQRENEFTARLSSIEAQMRALLPPWAIPETELEVTETVLGKGAYGEVRVGVYHGDRVAVKRLHNVIASDYYHKMIQREMGIAARLRHPKLVLFIGAVTRGNLTIVTELMETSLRSELEHGRLQEDHILPISHDVACALCYLHSLPEPIIHRDVSSANVLLNSTRGGWVAKLGDYGSANFQAKLQTVGPGCPVYAAPEASRPEEQGPKMDVYSYGVLVLEMCTGTLPDPRDLPVIQRAVHSWGQPKRQLGGLACQCTLQSSDRRPHMRNLVTQLNGM